MPMPERKLEPIPEIAIGAEPLTSAEEFSSSTRKIN